jgi:hypothetical protein
MQSESRSEERGQQNEHLKDKQRFQELISVIIGLLFLAFYVYNQVENTGFFTSKFGTSEMFAFYGSILLSFLPPLARAAIGRRNPVRPLEALSNIFFAFSTLYLLVVFPFNFAHFPDALPAFVRFMFWWLTNDIARIIFALVFLALMISAVVNIVKYLTFRLN